MKSYLSIVVILILCITCSREPIPSLIIKNEVISEVSPLLFGHFMEKASWDNEIGADFVINPLTGAYDSTVFALIQSMNIPVMRYPGGTDTDYYDWQNLIDNVPGTSGKRAPYRNRTTGKVVSDNRLGLNEFLDLCEKINSEAIIVLNLGDVFFGKLTKEEAARQAAALVAYCNKPVGYKYPGEKIDWPSIREKNGRKEPYKVKYFQIGNETFLFKGLKMEGAEPEMISHYLDCVEVLVNTVKETDPNALVIVDGGIREANKDLKPRFGDKIDYVCYHSYTPWSIGYFEKDGQKLELSALSAAEIWNGWTSTPFIETGSGVSIFNKHGYYQFAQEANYPIVVTEWNWNGWFQEDIADQAALDSKFAKGIGAAGFLHALIRESDKIVLGCQSMLVGVGWGITSIRVDSTGVEPTVMYPTGKVTSFYSNHHGNKQLALETKNIPRHPQPYKMNDILPAESIAVLDAVVTGTDKKLYIHVINRDYTNDIAAQIDLSSFAPLGTYTHRVFKPCGEDLNTDLGCTSDEPGNFKGKQPRITFPKQSVSILEIDL